MAQNCALPACLKPAPQIWADLASGMVLRNIDQTCDLSFLPHRTRKSPSEICDPRYPFIGPKNPVSVLSPNTWLGKPRGLPPVSPEGKNLSNKIRKLALEWCVTQSSRHRALSRNSLFNGNLQGIRDFLAAKIASIATIIRRNPSLTDQIPYAPNREIRCEEQGIWFC